MSIFCLPQKSVLISCYFNFRRSASIHRRDQDDAIEDRHLKESQSFDDGLVPFARYMGIQKRDKTMKFLKFGLVAATTLCSVSPLNAHHSFARFDLENIIEITGTLTEFSIKNPHVTLELETSDGTTTWHIESMNPRRWDYAGIPRDVAEVGETITILGWPAMDGAPSMALGTIITERGETVVRDRIRQGERER